MMLTVCVSPRQQIHCPGWIRCHLIFTLKPRLRRLPEYVISPSVRLSLSRSHSNIDWPISLSWSVNYLLQQYVTRTCRIEVYLSVSTVKEDKTCEHINTHIHTRNHSHTKVLTTYKHCWLWGHRSLSLVRQCVPLCVCVCVCVCVCARTCAQCIYPCTHTYTRAIQGG